MLIINGTEICYMVGTFTYKQMDYFTRTARISFGKGNNKSKDRSILLGANAQG